MEKTDHQNTLLTCLANVMAESNLTIMNASLIKGVLTLIQIEDAIRDDVADMVLDKLIDSDPKVKRQRQVMKLRKVLQAHPSLGVDLYNLLLNLLSHKWKDELPSAMITSILAETFCRTKEIVDGVKLESVERSAANLMAVEMMEDFTNHLEEIAKNVGYRLTRENLKHYKMKMDE